MKNINFELKTKAIFGVGEFQNLGKYLHDLGYSNVVLVIDKNVYKSPYVKDVIENLYMHIGIGEEKYYKITKIFYNGFEPTYSYLDKLMLQHENEFENINCFVGIGGGSTIDIAKGLAILATNKGSAIKYRGFPININKPISVVAIPSTAGSGSEATFNAVFIDKEKKKLGINTKLNFPNLAILDPKLLESCPRSVMISSGLDTLVHAIESYGSKGSNEISCMFAEKAINLILTYLQTDTKKLEYFSKLQLAAYLAGIANLSSSGGPAGALSYVLGPKFDLSHGLAGAIFLPHIIEHNENKGFKYPIENLSKKVFYLYELLGVDCYNIRKYNVTKASDLRILAKGIETLQPAFDQNPVPFTVEDAKDILREMIT